MVSDQALPNSSVEHQKPILPTASCVAEVRTQIAWRLLFDGISILATMVKMSPAKLLPQTRVEC